jgi:Tol biopolymer transport system component
MKFLQHVIHHEFTHEVQFNILYSGVWKTPLLLKSIFYPNWLLEGLAEYRSALYTKTLQEMLVRDMAVSNKLIPLEHLHNFVHLKPHMVLPAYEESAKLMEFIETEYGRERLVSILKLYKNKFDANSVLSIALGLDLKKLQQKFFEEMKTYYNYEVEINSMTDLDVSKKVTKNDVYPVHYYTPIIYQNKIIYLGDPEGKTMFYIVDEKGKEKLLIPKNVFDKNIDFVQTDTTRVSISKDGVLCFIGLKNNKSYLYLYNIPTKRLKKLSFGNDIDLLVSSYISSDGENIFLSGVKNCKSVIFKYETKTKKLTKLKEDENFISQICFDNEKLIYIKEQQCKKLNALTWQTDIFLYDLKTNEELRITSTLSDEEFPQLISDQHVLFISDYNEDYDKKFFGVKNLFVIDISSPTKFVRLTNVIGGVNYVYYCNNLVFLCYYRNFNQEIYKFNIVDFNKTDVSLSTNLLSESEQKEEIKKSLLKIKPYRFNFSTDLLLPFLYYSSYEGLVMLLYWQGSDMVGEHKTAVSSIVLGDRNYSVDIQYEFLKWRPIILLDLSVQSMYDIQEDIVKKLFETDIGIYYPLSRISAISVILSYLKMDKDFLSKFYTETKRDNIITFNYEINTIVGKYLEPVRGYYSLFTAQLSDKIYDSDFSYCILKYYLINYFNLGKDWSLFTNGQILTSFGKDKVSFYFGGPERFSGVWYSDVTSSQIGLLRLGVRIPLVYDINYYMWYLFPDLFFKSFYQENFIDFGLDAEKQKFYAALGVKFKLYTFVLQTYVLRFELTFAQQFEINKPVYVYFTISGGI